MFNFVDAVFVSLMIWIGIGILMAAWRLRRQSRVNEYGQALVHCPNCGQLTSVWPNDCKVCVGTGGTELCTYRTCDWCAFQFGVYDGVRLAPSRGAWPGMVIHAE